MAQEITAQSTPDYDEWFVDSYWTCTDWMVWYGELKKEHGRIRAREIWRSAWEKQDYLEHAYLWCKYEEAFARFVRVNKLGEPSTLQDIGGGIGDTVGGAAQGLGWVGRNVGWILPSALALYGAYYILKTLKAFKEVS